MVAPNSLTCGATVKQTMADGTVVERRCQKKPMRGQRICEIHGGKSKQNLKKGDRRQAVAEVNALALKLGPNSEADPMDVLLDHLYGAHGMAAAFQAAIQERTVGELIDDEDMDERNKTRYLMNQYDAWSMKAAQLAALALRAGVEERQVRSAETQVLGFVGAIRRAIDETDMPQEYRDALLAGIARQARLLASGSAA